MNETVQAEEQQVKDDSAEAPSSSTSAPPAETDDKETSPPNDASLKGTALLKSLLSTAAPTVPVVDKMITTTEVTDETLNLKKILYQPDKEKKEDKELESSTQNGHQANTNDTQQDDDDRRLVIDISDEERVVADHRTGEKSMPTLTSMEDGNKRMMIRPTTLDMTSFAPMRPLTRHLIRVHENQLPKSITYSFEPSATTGMSNSVKIDILAPAMNQTEVPSTTDRSLKSSSYQSQPKCSKVSSLDELNIISHEIDKQITKKTNIILELLKEFLNGTVDKNPFLTKMSDASETTLSDLLSVAKKLIKRHKFEPNPNHKEFMRIKFLQFPTTARDLVIYFDNLLPSLSKDKFISMIKFYEIIIKEMLNLNKTKILQYLIDFMVVRKNAQLDLLNYNFQVTSAPNLKQTNTTTTTFQLPDSTQNPWQNPSERRPMKLLDTSYNFIIRSDPIYLQAGSSFVTNHRDVITCRMSPRVQVRSFERKPFDNNILKGRRIGRRLVRSPDDEKIQADFIRTRFPMTPQSEPGTPLQQLTLMRSSTPIVVESDTPPPSLPSEPPSPPQHKIIKAQLQTAILIKPSRLDKPVSFDDEAKNDSLETHQLSAEQVTPTADSPNRQFLKRRASRSEELIQETNPNDPLQNGQISIQEIETLNQNGTEIIPTSILKSTIMSRRKTIELERHLVLPTTQFDELQLLNKPLPRGVSHEEHTAQQSIISSKMPKRRQSCHERIMMPPTENEDKTIENSAIGRNYMEFLNFYENEMRKNEQGEIQKQQQQQRQHVQHPQPLHAHHKRVRFSMEGESEEAQQSTRNRHPTQFHNPIPQQQQQQQQQQQHQQQLQQQQQQQQMENRHRMIQYQGQQRSPLTSPIKPHPPPINYQFYQHQFVRELRERGYDHRVENHQESNRPLELVSHIPPERYHQHEPHRTHYSNHGPPKPIRHVQEKPQRVQQRNIQMNVETQQAQMMAAAYHQLQSLHRDPSTLTPQQYAEHLKQLDHLKNIQPSAFQAYQRNIRSAEEQRPPPDYYGNTQEMHQQPPTRSSPAQYQISSSSSREDSPNGGYEVMNQEQSLQRKLKTKSKSSKYIEPNQLAKPFYNPQQLTYYTEPFALTKNKPLESSSVSPPSLSTAFHPPELQQVRSPVSRNLLETATNSKHYQWLMAQAHAQNLTGQNQPQRPIPRPPVPAFIEAKVNGSSIHHPVVQFQEQPTDFLRNFYANSIANTKNF